MEKLMLVVNELRKAGLKVSGRKGKAVTPKLQYPVASISIDGMPTVSEILTYGINQKSYLHELGIVRKAESGKPNAERKQAEYDTEI